MEPRHRELLEEMTRAIGGAVAGGRVGIAFSGGVDSTLMAKICADLGYGVTLLTIGFAGSHDVGFAREVNRHLGLPHHTLEIPPESFGRVSADIREMVGGCSLSWIENCIAFHYVSELARTLDISVVVTANGIDELFCGYNAYRETMAEGEQAVLRMMDTKIANEVKMMEVVNAVSARNSTRIVQPLLSAGLCGIRQRDSNKIQDHGQRRSDAQAHRPRVGTKCGSAGALRKKEKEGAPVRLCNPQGADKVYVNLFAVLRTDLHTEPIIDLDAPRCLFGANIFLISSRGKTEEMAASAATASI